MIRVLVVDDSPLFRNAFCAILQSDPELSVVATAENGHEAIELMQSHQPDIVTMDVNMPVLNGYEAIEQIMALCPTPVVIVTGSPSKQDKQAVMKSLAIGALDVLPKPDLSRTTEDRQPVAELIEKIKRFSSAHVVTHIAGLRKTRSTPPAVPVESTGATFVAAIAASTGGPAALAQVFSVLPGDLSASILVAQHITKGFTSTLVEWLESVTSLSVCVGEAGVLLTPGTALIAPSERHMRVASSGTMQLLDLPPVHGYKPSADILLTSVAEAFGDHAIGVVLTGMGNDGTDGLAAIKNRGGTTIAQDESTSVVFGMPRSAIDAGIVDHILPLAEIPDVIAHLAGRRKITKHE